MLLLDLYNPHSTCNLMLMLPRDALALDVMLQYRLWSDLNGEAAIQAQLKEAAIIRTQLYEAAMVRPQWCEAAII